MADNTGTAPTEVTPKKRVAKRPATKSKTKVATRPPAKKGAARPAAKKPGATRKAANKAKAAPKTPAKKTATPKSKTASKAGGFHRELDEHGFVPGTDSAKIAALLLAGGKSRQDVNEKVRKKIGGTTRNGTEKNVPALVSGVLNRLIEQGYKVESSFTVTAPARKRRRPSTKK